MLHTSLLRASIYFKRIWFCGIVLFKIKHHVWSESWQDSGRPLLSEILTLRISPSVNFIRIPASMISYCLIASHWIYAKWRFSFFVVVKWLVHSRTLRSVVSRFRVSKIPPSMCTDAIELCLTSKTQHEVFALSSNAKPIWIYNPLASVLRLTWEWR